MRRYRWLALFVVGYMVSCGALVVRSRNVEFLVYTGSMVAIIAAVVAIDRRVGFTRPVLWLLAVWGGLHMAGGTVPIPEAWADAGAAKHVLYSMRPWAALPRYDQVVHAFGFFAAALACHDALLAAAGRPARPPRSLAWAAALMGAGLGAVNEVLEFFITLTVPDHNVGGYLNTGWDLVANTVGAILAALWRLLRPRKQGGVSSEG